MAADKLIELNTNVNDILGGAVAGAALNAASGMAGGAGMTDKALKGAMVGAAVTVLAPTGGNIVAKIMPKKKPAAGE